MGPENSGTLELAAGYICSEISTVVFKMQWDLDTCKVTNVNSYCEGAV